MIYKNLELKWCRKCVCGKEISYALKGDAIRGSNRNSCRRCVKRPLISEETRKKLSLKLIGNKRTLGYKHSNITRNKLKNKIISENTREKLRKHRWEQIAKKGIKMANFNPKACNYIDNLNKCMGINLQHALNGGEIKVSWYSLDGYDKTKNIVFEYDEKYHESPSYKENDKIRETRIIKNINPILFLRYNESKNELYDSITNIPIEII